ncbi:MAG: hypothetical protein PHC43_01145 [Candidatus Marinimicrobia bacterium]|nr:hypothetical protein [Candidatus Neomarinimicrobiota bacterium]
MATTSYTKLIRYSTAESGTYVTIDGLNDATLSMTGDILDDTVFSTGASGFKSRLQALLDSNISLSGDYSTTAGQLALYNAWVGRYPLWIQYLPTGSTSGNGFQTSYVVESFEIAGAVADKNTISVSLQADSTGITLV